MRVKLVLNFRLKMLIKVRNRKRIKNSVKKANILMAKVLAWQLKNLEFTDDPPMYFSVLKLERTAKLLPIRNLKRH